MEAYAMFGSFFGIMGFSIAITLERRLQALTRRVEQLERRLDRPPNS